MAKKNTPPSIRETAFDCPHCGAHSLHTWYELYGMILDSKTRIPNIPTREQVEAIHVNAKFSEEDLRAPLAYAHNILSGRVFLTSQDRAQSVRESVGNLHISHCFSCRNFAVWVYDQLVHPPAMERPEPNPDLPESVRQDYDEAGTILSLSPRGAAALLRLAIQKLCKELGEKGKNIDDDIGSLVKKGLLPRVQQALDVVRVIGNEAVHPGTIDLKDDKNTAARLFTLVNIIAEQMISAPKHVQEMYDKLPQPKKKAIEARDGKPTEDK